MSDLPTTALGVLHLFSVSKPGIERFSKQLIDAVKSGSVNPLELKATFKAIENIIEKVTEETKQDALNELDKFSEKRFSYFGCEFEKAEVGVKYDYAGCGDSVYERRHVDFNDAKAKLDERMSFLKALKEPITLVDEMTGEVVTVRPPVKRSTEGFKTWIK